jgi:hypothetical protein
MERDIVKSLCEWKEKKNRKPLLLTGVRQCGKTYTIKQFGSEYFEHLVYLNFEGDESLKTIFDYNFDIERILAEIEILVAGAKIIAGKTLLFLDEIQECPRAITSLKYFCENKSDLHVICAGSLLGVAIKRENISFPVGKVDRLQMYPMSFYEFVRADGGEKYFSGLQLYDKESEIPEVFTEPLKQYLKNYYIVGGMPEAVASWCELHQYDEVDRIQGDILEDYANDFSKHAPLADIPKLAWIWDSIPKQLAKENNKFVFSHVKEGKRSKDLEDALQWLKDAGLIYRLELVEHPKMPLSFEADATYFKVYMADVGLLRRKAQVSYHTILNNDDQYIRFKGAMAENYVMNELICQGFQPYFWRSGNTAELDFLLESKGKLIPIEVKSADNTRAKSYRLFCDRYSPIRGFKVSLKNVGENRVGETDTYSLPLYLLWKLKDYL